MPKCLCGRLEDAMGRVIPGADLQNGDSSRGGEPQFNTDGLLAPRMDANECES